MKFKNIAISGDIGTGKSTLARSLAGKLGWEYVHTGTFFRKWHEEHGVPLEESEKIPPELDRQIDMDYQKKMETDDHTIFESQLAGWLAKDFADVLKVLCVTDEEVRMQRAANRDGSSVEEAKNHADIRSKSLDEKFKNLYGVENRFDPNYFDLVVDTTSNSPEEVLAMVMEKLSG